MNLKYLRKSIWKSRLAKIHKLLDKSIIPIEKTNFEFKGTIVSFYRFPFLEIVCETIVPPISVKRIIRLPRAFRVGKKSTYCNYKYLHQPTQHIK